MTGELKLIRDEADYEVALAELGRLWGRLPARPKAIASMSWQRLSTPMRPSTIRWTG